MVVQVHFKGIFFHQLPWVKKVGEGEEAEGVGTEVEGVITTITVEAVIEDMRIKVEVTLPLAGDLLEATGRAIVGSIEATKIVAFPVTTWTEGFVVAMRNETLDLN